ncbi:MAG: xanthine dehydrogenase family protein molybdopterin-binding subunit [Chloroflexi bacterium]|nr:xanthine dehydrogenase family protein molybdopterin-binding subunit [Chloroflexota bacterium]MCI0644999.1 xanthine dehydrogenase family protein molybdopterin-binding subunit [Chloroflexota bacterium]MCI0727422.1 xanthine dehydrogenase family protein molybdopterin-binding subunit [Chloroflexota bacterium]
MTTYTAIGRSMLPPDGRAKVTGTTRFAPDLRLPEMLHARLVISAHAHARIVEINTAGALAVPSVVAVLTAQELPEIAPKNRFRLLLARERVIFAGQPVALVLAENEAAAMDGAERVQVNYEPLPAAVTLEQALAGEAPLVWPAGLPGVTAEAQAHGAAVKDGQPEEQKRSNVCDRHSFSRGDITAGLAEADVIVERVYTTSRVHQSYIEPHASLVQPDLLTGGATIWTSTQAPFWIREEVAAILGVPESDVRIVGTPVGGAFGGKFILYEPLLALVAQRVGRPVRLVLTRLEEMVAGIPTPASRMRLKLGARRDGTLTALAAELTFDVGCYPSPHANAAFLLGSFYNIPNLDIHYTEVLTFKHSAAAYRAPGATQPTFALESAMDELAHQLALDPLALRLKNAAAPGDLMADGKPWPSMGMSQVLAALQAHPAWQEREQARAAGRGVGLAIGGWPGGTEPAAATCLLNRDGQLQVTIGSVDLTGTATGLALIAAEAFGMAPDKVRVINGDTASAPFGGAAGGSKITYTLGPAVIQAVREARTQVLEIAAEEFEADPADLEIVDGAVQVRGVPDKSITLASLAGKTMGFGGKYAPVVGRGRHLDKTASPGFCAQLAEVAVDEETGEVRVHRLVVVQDVGRAINPPGIYGQMMGGAVQGLGLALYERMAYDESGQVLTGSWMEYTVPHADQAASLIEMVIVEVPAEHGPFGARGVGEPPIIPTAAAVANAVADATGRRLTDLPMTPERVLAAG